MFACTIIHKQLSVLHTCVLTKYIYHTDTCENIKFSACFSGKKYNAKETKLFSLKDVLGCHNYVYKEQV